MSRYINADKMIADTEAMRQISEAITIDGIVKYINEHATADVQEVKHGKWIEEEDEENSILIHGTCSVCGFQAIIMETDVFGSNYCPNCGAKMDGKDGTE